MTEPVCVLLIFVNEADLWFATPLYEAIVKRLLELGVAGATAQPCLIGFGHHHHVHGKGVFGRSGERPVTITVVDANSKIEHALPEIRRMAGERLILRWQADVVAGAGAWSEKSRG